MTGQIISLHTDDYLVKSEEKIYRLSARGKLKGSAVLVGDYVDFSEGAITNVHERKNRFIRPSIANVDVVVAVLSPVPEPDFLMIDKLVASAVMEEVPIIFCVNKADLGDKVYKQVLENYKSLGKIHFVSTETKAGIEELKESLRGKFAVLAGQSAVGKSSLVNALFGTQIKTGQVSEIGRGKHTTTSSQIYEFDDIRLTDTPGFAVLEAMVSADELKFCYPEFNIVLGECKFRGCSHTNEPDCKIKELVSQGEICKDRYDRYVQIYNEIKNKKRYYK